MRCRSFPGSSRCPEAPGVEALPRHSGLWASRCVLGSLLLRSKYRGLRGGKANPLFGKTDRLRALFAPTPLRLALP